ncbi:MAG: hypothetical protein QW784_05705, partial [Acidilobaceae archaeon]
GGLTSSFSSRKLRTMLPSLLRTHLRIRQGNQSYKHFLEKLRRNKLHTGYSENFANLHSIIIPL